MRATQLTLIRFTAIRARSSRSDLRHLGGPHGAGHDSFFKFWISKMSREGSLEAPTRHPIKWRDPDFTDMEKIDAEMRRVFDICHGCRRCFNLCDSFPRLFDLID